MVGPHPTCGMWVGGGGVTGVCCSMYRSKPFLNYFLLYRQSRYTYWYNDLYSMSAEAYVLLFFLIKSVGFFFRSCCFREPPRSLEENEKRKVYKMILNLSCLVT